MYASADSYSRCITIHCLDVLLRTLISTMERATFPQGQMTDCWVITHRAGRGVGVNSRKVGWPDFWVTLYPTSPSGTRPHAIVLSSRSRKCPRLGHWQSVCLPRSVPKWEVSSLTMTFKIEILLVGILLLSLVEIDRKYPIYFRKSFVYSFIKHSPEKPRKISLGLEYCTRIILVVSAIVMCIIVCVFTLKIKWPYYIH